MKLRFGSRPQAIVLVLVLIAAGGIYIKRQAIMDWSRLYNYDPPSMVNQLAADDTMTSRAKHLFYVNHPDITRGNAFTSHCPNGDEKTVVLGCYIGSDNGIFIYNVTDSRLMGVEQVTAAHEMLHAAYDRLSGTERKQVDMMLENYYNHDLHDARIRSTIEAYKKSEPNDVVNEMHSVFGTEIANLPAGLERYYSQYFTNRNKVTNFTATYEGEFTSRQNQLAQYDTQLKMLKAQIDENNALLESQKKTLDTQSAQLERYKATNDYAAYNTAVVAYNAGVAQYNALVNTTKAQISQYNELVNKRNTVALEERQLIQSIASQPTTE